MTPLAPFALLLTTVLLAAPLASQTKVKVDPLGRAVLFVRGADGSGGATEGGTKAQRTEQLGDVFNKSTAKGNHGWDSLRQLLVWDGFKVSQRIESSTGLTLKVLAAYRIVVFGSNNKIYSSSEVKAFHDYTDAGGSALFISDANFGLTWEAAPASDNQFLARYGAQVYQDGGGLPTMARKTKGRYLLPNHPALSGADGAGGTSDVNQYNGEGVSMFRITKGANGYQAVRLVSATGSAVRLNTTTGKAGTMRAASSTDAALIFVEKGDSRIVGHFDRNTFFNLNGAGTSLFKGDNAVLAIDIFRYLASVRASATVVGVGCGKSKAPSLTATSPVLTNKLRFTLQGASASVAGSLLVSIGGAGQTPLGKLCTAYLDLKTYQTLAPVMTDASGGWSLDLTLIEAHALSGLLATCQVVTFVPGGPFSGNAELSNGLTLRLGFPR